LINEHNLFKHLQDLKVESDNKLALRAKIAASGNKLLRFRPSDTLVRDRLDKLEESWLRLVDGNPALKEKVESAQELLLPSTQAMNDLTAWLTATQATFKQETTNKLEKHEDISQLLNKIKVPVMFLYSIFYIKIYFYIFINYFKKFSLFSFKSFCS